MSVLIDDREVKFFSIEYAGEEQVPLRRAPGILLSALADVFIIWYRKFFVRGAAR